MANLYMGNSYHTLNIDTINSEVKDNKIGNYALGEFKSDKNFYVSYIGRSDKCLKSRLKDHLGEPYKHFKFSYADSKKEAFEKECHNWHDFGENKKLKNEMHPDRPDGLSCNCPKCNKFD